MVEVRITVSDLLPGNPVTRDGGKRLAEAVAPALREGRRVVLDWSGAEVVSSPFAQGFLGSLLDEFTFEFMKQNVRHENLEGLARASFRWAAGPAVLSRTHI